MHSFFLSLSKCVSMKNIYLGQLCSFLSVVSQQSPVSSKLQIRCRIFHSAVCNPPRVTSGPTTNSHKDEDEDEHACAKEHSTASDNAVYTHLFDACLHTFHLPLHSLQFTVYSLQFTVTLIAHLQKQIPLHLASLQLARVESALSLCAPSAFCLRVDNRKGGRSLGKFANELMRTLHEESPLALKCKIQLQRTSCE